MKSLEKAAFSATYKTVWCAGPSIEHVKEIRNIKEIVTNSSGSNSFLMSFQSKLDDGDSEGIIVIDNIKVIHF